MLHGCYILALLYPSDTQWPQWWDMTLWLLFIASLEQSGKTVRRPKHFHDVICDQQYLKRQLLFVAFSGETNWVSKSWQSLHYDCPIPRIWYIKITILDSIYPTWWLTALLKHKVSIHLLHNNIQMSRNCGLLLGTQSIPSTRQGLSGWLLKEWYQPC